MNFDFKKLMTARFLVTMGLQIQAVILGWQMYVLTQNPLYLGLIGLTEAIPAIGLALHAGLLVDRTRPLLIFRGLLIVCFLSGLVMLLFQQSITGLFCASFLTGLARAFSQPSMFAIVPRIIPRDQLPQASAWMASAMQIARISGPAVGGILFGLIGMHDTSLVACMFLLSAVICAWLIDAPELTKRQNVGSKSHEPVGSALIAGLKYVYAHPILMPALSLDMISVLFGGVIALLPIFAAEILHVGAVGLGFLRAAPALGAAITSLWLTTVDIRRKAGTWLFSSVFAFGLCILVFSISQNYILSFVALAFSGAFDSVSMVIRTTAVQLVSPDSMRGRISSVNSIFISSSNELGEFESGVAARLMGTVPAAIFGGVICLMTVIIVATISPKLRRLNLHEL